MTYIDLLEFIELGGLQEVNRRFFWPLGLALTASVDDDSVALVGIQDAGEPIIGVDADKVVRWAAYEDARRNDLDIAAELRGRDED